jgi:hypothetical protein
MFEPEEITLLRQLMVGFKSETPFLIVYIKWNN